MTTVDWIAAAVIGLAALNGLRRGLVGGALSLAGIVAGAYFGAKLAPQFLSGTESAYTPLVALAGAVALGFLLQSLAAMAGSAIRSSLFVLPPLRVLDSAGGLVLGAVAGAAIVWVAGAVALHIPGQVQLREEVQRSRILGELNARVPPSRLLDAIARVDPFSSILGPVPNVAPPDPALLDSAGVRLASPSVFRVIGTACGLGVEGSGWVAATRTSSSPTPTSSPECRTHASTTTTATPATPTSSRSIPATTSPCFGSTGSARSRSAWSTRSKGQAVAILGYPENGPFTATAGRIGQTREFLTDDAYGRGPFPRRVTTLRGVVRHGNSGGPAVDSQGRVRTMIFASRIGSASGYGVPSELVRRALDRISATEVSSGPCVR